MSDNNTNRLQLVQTESNCVKDKNGLSKHECEPPDLFQVPTGVVSMSYSHSSHDETDDSVKSNQTISKTSKELSSVSNITLSSQSILDSNQACESRKVSKSNSNGAAKASSQGGVRVPAKRSAAFPVTAEAELESIEGDDESCVEGATHDSSSMNHANIANDSIPLSTAMEVIEKKHDMFCWRCHRITAPIHCSKCPRSYHGKCLKNENLDLDNWSCPECVLIAEAENVETRHDTLKRMPIEHLCYLLRFALSRMIKCQGADPFMQPVSQEEFPEYSKYIIQPMDLETLESNLENFKYSSPQAFEADAKWILHNSIIFNSTQSKLTSIAKSIMKICKHEMSELENCPSCYRHANTKKSTWFVEVCPKPHLLVWAKLKGFPFWPAKVMRYNNSQGLVDVGFFGAHDRAWVPMKECYLFCEKDPNTFKPKRYDIEECLKEMNIHIQNLKNVYEEFNYAEYRTLIDPDNEVEQLKILLPKYRQKPYVEIWHNPNCVRMEITEHSDESESDESSEISNEEVEAVDDHSSKTGSLDETFDSSNLMEGYGTDDESLPIVDPEKRKMFNKRFKDISEIKESEVMDIDDGDNDEDDTQVSVESCLSDGNSTILPNTSNGQKMPLRRKSEVEFGSTRSFDYSPKTKMTRRNSDMSVTTDSNRISGISEKINRVDIKENMEISLGIISESLSIPNSDASKDNELGMELKRKPVQVNIDNAEFSISPTNKLKITEQLMKRLSEESNNTNSRIEEAKRKIPNSESILQSNNENIANDDKSSDKDSSNISDTSSRNETFFNSSSNNSHESTEKDDENKDKDNQIKVVDAESVSSNQTLMADLNDVPESTFCKNRSMVQPAITEFITKSVPKSTVESNVSVSKDGVEDITDDNPQMSKGGSKRTQMNGTYSPENDRCTDSDESLVSDIQMDKFDLFNIIHSSLNDETDLKRAVVISRDINIQPSSQDEVAEQTKPVEDPLKKQNELVENANVENNSLSVPVCNKSTSRDLVVQLLNYGNLINDDKNDANTEDMTKDQDCQKKSPEQHSVVEGAVGEIRVKNLPKECDRLENDTVTSDISSVDIRRPSSEGRSKSGLKRKLSHGATPERPKKMAGNPSNSQQLTDMEEIVIKSEPECSDDDFLELEEDLEKKRRYLSALDISEKIDSPSRERQLNQIRTRSKAEEKRAKYRAFDNLSKTIEDVATNYGVLHGEEVGKHKASDSCEGPKKQFNSSSSKLKAIQPGQRARKSFPAPIYSIASGSDIPKTSGPYLRVIQSSNQLKTGKTGGPLTSESNSSVPHLYLLHPSSLVNTVYDRPSSTVNTKPISHGTSVQHTPSTSKSSILMTQILQPVARPPIYIQKPSSKVQMGNSPLLRTKLTGTYTQGTQNYIPLQKSSIVSSSQTSPRIILNDHINLPGQTPTKETPSLGMSTASAPSTSQDNNYVTNTNSSTDIFVDNSGDDYTELNRLLPEGLGPTLSKILLKPAPKPKPRPPGILSQRFDTGIPSSAGEVTSKINSIAHRMADYFRGMLIETIEEFGTKNAEGKVVALELELERVKHAHKLELEDAKSNFTRILTEIQLSLARDREELEEKVRAECEAETIRRIELAKSKQWCANCSKEAQFYCCWNTSYCDYPCQQKHWAQHMKNCTQHLEKSSAKASSTNPRKSQSGSLSSSVLKQGMGLQRPHLPNKVYPRASGVTKLKPAPGRFKLIKPSPGNLDLQELGAVRVATRDYPLNTTLTSGIIRVGSPSPPPNTTGI